MSHHNRACIHHYLFMFFCKHFYLYDVKCWSNISLLSSVKMAGGSIKLLQFFEKCHQTCGILPRPPNQKKKQLSTNSIRTIFLTVYVLHISTTAAFLILEAKSWFDYGFTLYNLISIFDPFVVYLIFIWQSGDTLEFIENCERFIDKSTLAVWSWEKFVVFEKIKSVFLFTGIHSTAEYNELNEKIELFNKLLYFLFASSLLIVLLTAVSYTIVQYFIFDMGEDSFYLFIPAWFVFT